MLQTEERRELHVSYPEVAVLVEDREERMGVLSIDVAGTEGEQEVAEEVLTGAFGLRADARRRRDDDEEEAEEEFGEEGAEDGEEYDDDLDEDLEEELDDDDLDDDFDDDFDDEDDDE